MFSAYLNSTDNTTGLPEEIRHSIKNEVSEDVAMYITSWQRQGDVYVIQVERHEYYEAMLPDPGENISDIEIKFDAITNKRM